MKAQAKTKEAAADDILTEALEPPAGVDFLWVGGASGPAQRALAWRVACRGGTVSDIAGKIPGLAGALTEARSNMARAEARLATERAAELRNFIASTAVRLAQLTTIVEAAGGRVETDERGKVRVHGGWIDADQRALDRAVGLADFALQEATGKVAPYRVAWPPLKDWEKILAAELREEAKAEAALKAAQKAAAENLALLDADRAELMKLRARRVA